MSVAFQPKTPEPTPTALGDLDIPTAEPGRPIPVVFGDVVVRSPNIVWYGDLFTRKIKTGGGK